MPNKKSKSKQQASMTPFIFLIIGVILILVAAVVLTQPRDNSTGAINQDDIARVTAQETRAAVRDSGALILDVRSLAAYETSHAEGAINIPLEDLSVRMSELDPQQWIITYCTWPAEETSARAAKILLDNGFEKVNPIVGGLQAWVDAGYPLEP